MFWSACKTLVFLVILSKTETLVSHLNNMPVCEQSVYSWYHFCGCFVYNRFIFPACENIRFSSLFAAGDVSRRGTSATQGQKIHTDDANQCLHNTNTNLSNFTCLLVDFDKVLCSSAKELQQNSNASSGEDYIPQILTILLEILCD